MVFEARLEVALKGVGVTRTHWSLKLGSGWAQADLRAAIRWNISAQQRPSAAKTARTPKKYSCPAAPG